MPSTPRMNVINFTWAIPNDTVNFLPFIESRNYLIAPFPNGFHLPIILRDFALAYILGMLVRYYPSRWMSIVHNRKHDQALPLLMELVDHVEREFPYHTLEALN